MGGLPSSSGTGGDLSIGPALEQQRRDNFLTNVVHDPAEDAPRIVGLPGQQVQRQVVVMREPFSWRKWLGIAFVAAIVIGAVVMAVTGYLSTAELLARH